MSAQKTRSIPTISDQVDAPVKKILDPMKDLLLEHSAALAVLTATTQTLEELLRGVARTPAASPFAHTVPSVTTYNVFSFPTYILIMLSELEVPPGKPPGQQVRWITELWRSIDDGSATPEDLLTSAEKIAETQKISLEDHPPSAGSWRYWLRFRDPDETQNVGDFSPDEGIPFTNVVSDVTERFYIKPVTGTALKNHVGTLRIEAHEISEGLDQLLSIGTIQLFDPSNNLITVANGYHTGSDGYTGVFDAGDINGSVVITLKDGATGDPLDTITLVDVADVDPGVINGIQAGGGGDIRFAINRLAGGTADDGEVQIFGSVFLEPDGTVRIFNGTKQVNTPFEVAVVPDGPFYLMWTQTLPVTRFGAGWTTAGSINNNIVPVIYNTVTPGWEAVGNDNTRFAFTPGGTDFLLATLTKLSVTGGIDTILSYIGSLTTVYASIDPSNGLAWTRAPDLGAWTPAGTTTDLVCTFYRSGQAVATRNVRITLNTTNGTLTSALQGNTGEATSHTTAGEGTTALTVNFAHTPSGVTVSETVLTAQGGDNASTVRLAATGQTFSYDNSTGTPVLIGPTQINFTLSRQNITGATTWQAFDDTGAEITPVSTILTGMTDIAAIMTEANFDAQTNNDFIRVRATAQGIADEISVYRLLSGENVVVGFLTNEAHVVAANNDGTGYSLAGSGGTFKVFQGITDVTTSSAFSVVAPATKNGLTIAIGAATGIYTLSGASWTTDAEVFTLRAVFAGVTIDKQYSISKSRAGVDPVFYYIKPINGTAIHNGSGTLTIEAHRITGGADILLSSGTIKLFDPADLEVTVANGYAAGSDGFTGVLDSGDISGAKIITLKDGIAGTPLDTVALVDIADGATGVSVFVGNVFLRKATAPSTPVADDGQYNFTTNVLTPPSIVGGSADDWFVNVPAGSNPLYVSTGAFEISGPTGTDTTVAWVAPVILASDGAVGGDGNSVHVASAFLRKSTAPATPVVDDGSYNFTTTTLTPPSIVGGSADDWFVNVPAGSDPLYVVNGIFEINGTTGTDNTVTWSAPVVLASDGATGAAGSDAVAGFIEANPTLAWVQAVNNGVWTPTNTSTQLDVTFTQGGADVARVGRTINRSATGILTDGGAAVHGGGDLNTSRITPTITGPSSQALTVEFAYSFGGETSSVGETVLTSRSGDDALQYYIKPIDGTAIHNSVGNITLEAHLITGGVDILLSSGTIQLFDPSNLIVNVANGYVTGSDGYTGILDSGDISGDKIITLKDGAAGAALDTITVVDIADGVTGPGGADQVYGFIEAIPTLAWVRDLDEAWVPTDAFTRIDVTFVQGGSTVARNAHRINRNAVGILTDGGDATHGSGDLNTTRITPTVTGGSTQAATIKFDYSFSGDVASVAETVITALAGENPVTGFLTNDSEVVPHDGNGQNGDFTNANGEFKVFEGIDDVSTSAVFSEVSETNCTGDINTTVDEFFTGPKGAYRVTAMPDSQSNGQYKIRAVFNTVTIDKVFTVTKSFAPLSVNITPPNVNADCPTGPCTTGNATANISGGTPSYTPAWTWQSGGAFITINSPSSSATTFTGTGSDVERTGVALCTVTDANSQTAADTCNVNIIIGTPP